MFFHTISKALLFWDSKASFLCKICPIFGVKLGPPVLTRPCHLRKISRSSFCWYPIGENRYGDQTILHRLFCKKLIAAIRCDRVTNECCCASCMTIDVVLKTFICNIHLAKSSQDRVGAMVVTRGDIVLQCFYKALRLYSIQPSAECPFHWLSTAEQLA